MVLGDRGIRYGIEQALKLINDMLCPVESLDDPVLERLLLILLEERIKILPNWWYKQPGSWEENLKTIISVWRMLCWPKKVLKTKYLWD